MSKIKVRLLLDREKKRVVFAEAGSDFIDVLFSFLTLPLGSIVRLLGKQTGLGSLDNIYESVEQLDIEDLQTEACKEMLLNPRSAVRRSLVSKRALTEYYFPVLWETTLLKNGNGVLGGINKVGNVVKGSLLTSKYEDGADFSFLSEAGGISKWEIGRIEGSKKLTI